MTLCGLYVNYCGCSTVFASNPILECIWNKWSIIFHKRDYINLLRDVPN